MHYASADTPEERAAQALTLNGGHYGVEPMLEPYASWYREQDPPDVPLLPDAAQMPTGSGPASWQARPPPTCGRSTLTETPDVSVVWSHRDPLLCILCSMTWAIPNGALQIPKQAGRWCSTATRFGARIAVRDRSDRSPFVDVTHDDFVRMRWGGAHLRPLRAAASKTAEGGHAGTRTRQARPPQLRARGGDSRRAGANASSPPSSASTGRRRVSDDPASKIDRAQSWTEFCDLLKRPATPFCATGWRARARLPGPAAPAPPAARRLQAFGGQTGPCIRSSARCPSW
jgi:hypothetical protein